MNITSNKVYNSTLWPVDLQSQLLLLFNIVALSILFFQYVKFPYSTELNSLSLLNKGIVKCKEKFEKGLKESIYDYYELDFSCTCKCVEAKSEIKTVQFNVSVVRSQGNKRVKKEVKKKLQVGTVPFTEEKLTSSQPLVPTQLRTIDTSTKHLPPSLEAATPGVGAINDPLTVQDQASGLTEATGYTTSTLPGATGSHFQHYGTDFDKDQPLSREEGRKDVRVVSKEKDIDTILEAHRKDEVKKLSTNLQATAKPSTKPKTSSNVDRPPRLPRRACIAYKSEQYSLDPKLLLLPRATKYLVKVRTEISPGRFMAKLELHCSR